MDPEESTTGTQDEAVVFRQFHAVENSRADLTGTELNLIIIAHPPRSENVKRPSRMVDSSSREAGGSNGGHFKAETLVGRSRDVGLARQDTSVAFVRQILSCTCFFVFLSHIYLYMCSVSSSLVCVV